MTEYVTEQNQNALNEDYDAKMTLKYAGKIKDGNLEIGNYFNWGDPEVTNLRFLETFDIQTLTLFISNDLSVKLRSNTIKKLLFVVNFRQYDQDEKQKQKLNMQVDDLKLEHLEVLALRKSVENDQLYNLSKFKKLHTLDVSMNNIDLTHIHSVISLTKLTMVSCKLKNINLISSLVNLKELDLSYNKGIKNIAPLQKLNSLTTLNIQDCGLQNIDKISSLVNLEEFDLSGNIDIDLSPLYKIKSLTNLSMRQCELKNIDQIAQLTNLEILNIYSNLLKNIDQIAQLINLKELDISGNDNLDITPLKDLVGLIKLNLRSCALTQLSALKPIINLQDLNISSNYYINITELQYFKNLTHLNLNDCDLVSVYVLRPLVNIEVLHITDNNLVHLDANLNDMKNLKKLQVQGNIISDFTSVEKHPNYNINNGFRCFCISHQEYPSEEDLHLANKFRQIESPNIQLKLIPHKSLKMAFNNFKQEINVVLNNARQSQIQFTANIVRLFQQLNQFGLE
ncbi:leucine-rich_repeat domain-containing protein [Hexamita inflata]|uniref:Leucine-rich repeat domain-containing protein n=1 Tax=Hexamita inflata TaxID=28002 RepID=A0AA86V6P0_9EUKA|nr:leucine-rich repeat domain-containing protein [Hexamita inflata]